VQGSAAAVVCLVVQRHPNRNVERVPARVVDTGFGFQAQHQGIRRIRSGIGGYSGCLVNVRRRRRETVDCLVVEGNKGDFGIQRKFQVPVRCRSGGPEINAL